MANYNTWNNISSAGKISTLASNWTYLNSGYQQTSTVTFSFLSADDGRIFQDYIPDGESANFQSFTAYERGFTRIILDYLEGFLDIDFVEVFDNSATLGFGKHNMTSGGYADYPGISKQAVYISNGGTNNSIGDFGLGSIVHELGHALGLSHPNDYSEGGQNG